MQLHIERIVQRMKDRKKRELILINGIYALALSVVIFPLLLIAQYNYPTADDWSFGVNGYQALQSGGGLLDVLKASGEMVYDSYMKWEGRFSAVLFGSLQPGIWGENYYGIVAWIMLGAIILSEVFLCKSLLCEGAKGENRWLWFPVIAPALIMQILYCPYPEESFYWYTGSVNYTFAYGLSLILLVLFWKLATKVYKKWVAILLAFVASVLGILVGGNNFATSLSTFLALGVLSGLFLIYDRRAFSKTWYITVLTGCSLLFCILAPGNANRINSNFGGETGGAVEAIWMSLVRSFWNIYSWTNIKVLLMILLILPFAWKCVKNSNFTFKMPGIFTFLTFGLYASQIVATMYVDGTTGGGRMGAILYYSYYVWFVGNVVYWIGWLAKRQNKIKDLSVKILLPYCAVIGVLLVGTVYATDLKELTSYRAYRNWRQGFAQQYSAEWDARLEILHDDSIKDVEFQFLTVYPDMLLYTDLQDENGYVWVNDACAIYYNKNSIRIVSPEK